MRRKRFSVFGVSAVLSVAITVLGNSGDETLKQLAGYREWTRVTDKPIPVTSFLAGA